MTTDPTLDRLPIEKLHPDFRTAIAASTDPDGETELRRYLGDIAVRCVRDARGGDLTAANVVEVGAIQAALFRAIRTGIATTEGQWLIDVQREPVEDGLTLDDINEDNLDEALISVAREALDGRRLITDIAIYRRTVILSERFV